tara:strand:- start:11533 stop:11823 length:291 start_codon:yes stop_codon:yes gene_type:complete
VPDKYNTVAPESANNNTARRPSTALTPEGGVNKGSDWKNRQSREARKPKNRDKLPGNTAAMRKVRAKFRTGRTLTPKEKTLLAKMKSMKLSETRND